MEQKLYDAAAKLPETDLVFENIPMSPKVPAVRPWRKIAVLAACMALLITAGFGAYAYAAEIKEYNQAVQFFAENGLSTEGLTRDEIKAVYRDITTNSFTYSKTVEVLEKRQTTQQVPGHEIDRENSTVEENTQPINQCYYRVRNRVKDEDGKFKCFVEKYDRESLLWQIKIRNFDANGHTVLSDGGIVVYGNGSIIKRDRSIIRLGKNGEVLLDHILKNEEISAIKAVVENADGSLTAFSMGWAEEKKCLCINQISADGQDILFKAIEMEDNFINCAARLGDSYLLQLGNRSRIVKMDREGNITEAFSYSEADVDYFIQDMIEFNGKVYMSAYAVPKSEGESFWGKIFKELDVAGYLERVKNGEEERDSKKFDITDRFQKQFTAVLLVCDASTGQPQEFYSVKECRGKALAINDAGMLVWNVEDILSAYFTPWFSSRLMEGTSCLYRYTLDHTGKLVSQEKDNKITNIWG